MLSAGSISLCIFEAKLIAQDVQHIVQCISQKPDLCSAMSLGCMDMYIDVVSFDYKRHTASRPLSGVALVSRCLAMQEVVWKSDSCLTW